MLLLFGQPESLQGHDQVSERKKQGGQHQWYPLTLVQKQSKLSHHQDSQRQAADHRADAALRPGQQERQVQEYDPDGCQSAQSRPSPAVCRSPPGECPIRYAPEPQPAAVLALTGVGIESPMPAALAPINTILLRYLSTGTWPVYTSKNESTGNALVPAGEA